MSGIGIGIPVGGQAGAYIGAMGQGIGAAVHGTITRNAAIEQSLKSYIASQNLDPSKVKIMNYNSNGDVIFSFDGTKRRLSHSKIGYNPRATVRASTQATSSTAPVGRQANVSSSVASRTNVPGPASATSASAASAASSSRPTIPFGKNIVEDNPVLGEGNIFVSGTKAGSAEVTAKISTSGAKTAAEDAAKQAAKHAASSSAKRSVDNTASKLVASGAKDSKNLRIAGAAAILAVGTLAMRGRSKSSAEHERSLMMQRQGIYR